LKITDKVAFLTGASGGIGRAVARGLTAAGFPVGINYARRKEQAKGVLADIIAKGGKGITLHADVSNPNAVHAMCRVLENRLGRL
jgi:3-oxoacyl-[acyl-carrier protein] reductase